MKKHDAMLQTLQMNRPCDCDAPIAFNCTDENEKERTQLYMLDSEMNSTIIFDGMKGIIDSDNLSLVCTRCGADWTTWHNVVLCDAET
jgi:hypothetical protein